MFQLRRIIERMWGDFLRLDRRIQLSALVGVYLLTQCPKGLDLRVGRDGGLRGTGTANTQANKVKTEGRIDPFAGGSDSLVACVIGAAEGTRDLNCSKNPAYYGHEDPCLKAGICSKEEGWNIGTFSVNCKRAGCGAEVDTPEKADVFYLNRLKSKVSEIQSQMQETGQYFTGWDFLLILDLCNQSPEACLGWKDGNNPGAVKLLGQLKKQGQSDFYLLDARTLSYKNLRTEQFESFRKTKEGMDADQLRRIEAAIESAKRWFSRKGYQVGI